MVVEIRPISRFGRLDHKERGRVEGVIATPTLANLLVGIAALDLAAARKRLDSEDPNLVILEEAGSKGPEKRPAPRRPFRIGRGDLH